MSKVGGKKSNPPPQQKKKKIEREKKKIKATTYLCNKDQKEKLYFCI